MAKPAITPDVHQPLLVQRKLGSQTAFHSVVVLDDPTQVVQVIRCEIVHPRLGIDVRLLADLACGRSADPVDVRKSNVYMLVGQVYSCYARHILPLSLSLLVLRLRADDAYDAAAPYDPTILAHRLNAYSHLHMRSSLQVPSPYLAFLHQPFVVVHSQVPLDLGHSVQIHTNHD